MTQNTLDSSAEKYPLYSKRVLTIRQIFWTKFMLCSRKTKQCYYFENNGIYTLRKNFGDSLFQVHHFEFIALRMFHVRERSRLIEIQFFFMKLNQP